MCLNLFSVCPWIWATMTFIVILFDNSPHVYVFHSKQWLCTIQAWFCLSSLCNITAHSNLQNTIRLGAYPFNETNFLDISRTRINFSRALKFTLMLLHYLDLNVNSPYCLPYNSYFLQYNLVLSTGLKMGIGQVKRFKGWCYKHLVKTTDFQNQWLFSQNFPVMENATI